MERERKKTGIATVRKKITKGGRQSRKREKESINRHGERRKKKKERVKDKQENYERGREEKRGRQRNRVTYLEQITNQSPILS